MFVRTDVYVSVYTCMYHITLCVNTLIIIMCVCTHKCVFISAHVCVFVNDSEHVYVCVSMFMCV